MNILASPRGKRWRFLTLMINIRGMGRWLIGVGDGWNHLASSGEGCVFWIHRRRHAATHDDDAGGGRRQGIINDRGWYIEMPGLGFGRNMILNPWNQFVWYREETRGCQFVVTCNRSLLIIKVVHSFNFQLSSVTHACSVLIITPCFCCFNFFSLITLYIVDVLIVAIPEKVRQHSHFFLGIS